jgi:hypothetical protein
MDKKVIFIGLGVVALGGLAFFLFRKKGGAGAASVGGAATRGADVGAGAGAGAGAAAAEEVYDESLDAELGMGAEPTRKEIRQERRAVRRNCKAEAKSKGLKWGTKKRRNFMRDCKAAGGENADFTSEVSDFAFNGF